MAVAVVERFKQEPMYELSFWTKKTGQCREVAVAERFKQDSFYGLSAGTKKSGRCREVAVGGGSTAYNNFRSAETKKCRTHLLP